MRKEKMSSSRADERAKIPYALSSALSISIESAFDFTISRRLTHTGRDRASQQ
jgi:hypothetical protein